jgi:hypothetical protein
MNTLASAAITLPAEPCPAAMREISQASGAASIGAICENRRHCAAGNGQVMTTDAFDTTARGP